MKHHERPEPAIPRFREQASLYPLVIILGPSASGKSGLALSLAERFAGEIVNFDSVQIYRHFDIGSAKTPPAEQRGIPHHLLDIVEPGELFSAGDYAHRAREALDAIRSRHRLPLLVGGTGFYLRAALQGLFRGPARDEQLRKRLSAAGQRKPSGYLHGLLGRLDARSAERIHPHDTPKIIRAVEVSLRARAPMSSLWDNRTEEALAGYNLFRLGLDPPRPELYERIGRRSEAMFAAGLVDEVRRLLSQGVSRDARPFGSLGYRQVLAHLDGRLTIEQADEETAKCTRRYAKRQMTWFRREPDVTWFPSFGDAPATLAHAADWLAAKLAPYRDLAQSG